MNNHRKYKWRYENVVWSPADLWDLTCPPLLPIQDKANTPHLRVPFPPSYLAPSAPADLLLSHVVNFGCFISTKLPLTSDVQKWTPATLLKNLKHGSYSNRSFISPCFFQIKTSRKAAPQVFFPNKTPRPTLNSKKGSTYLTVLWSVSSAHFLVKRHLTV